MPARIAAEIQLAAGHPDAAIELAEQALAAEGSGASAETTLSALLTAAQAERTVGRSAEARARYQRAADTVRHGFAPSRRRQVLAEFAQFLTESGDEKAALLVYREAT